MAQPKVWLITGASSGLGRAFAEHALQRGDSVVAAARRADRLQTLVDQAPDRALALSLDLDREDDLPGALDAAVARFGRLDVLVNNAGYSVVGALEETSQAELRAIMQTNFFGPIALSRAAAGLFRAQGSGVIANVTSLCGQMSMAGLSAYSASKFALEGATEALAHEMAPFGVKVIIVEPGAFRTDLNGAALREMPADPAYDAVSGTTRRLIHDMHGLQGGDPARAAEALARVIDAEDPPLRLPLGQDCIGAIRAHAAAQLADIDRWAAIAGQTGYPAETV